MNHQHWCNLRSPSSSSFTKTQQGEPPTTMGRNDPIHEGLGPKSLHQLLSQRIWERKQCKHCLRKDPMFLKLKRVENRCLLELLSYPVLFTFLQHKCYLISRVTGKLIKWLLLLLSHFSRVRLKCNP